MKHFPVWFALGLLIAVVLFAVACGVEQHRTSAERGPCECCLPPTGLELWPPLATPTSAACDWGACFKKRELDNVLPRP